MSVEQIIRKLPIVEQICGNCRFFDGVKHDGSGDCRRYAPRSANTNVGETARAQWPQVERWQWCGEFRPEPQED